MPVLPNPRHEAFARAIFATTCDPKLYPTHGHAYNAAGYRARDAGKAGGSAEVNASNLLKKTKIAERVRELQEQAAESADKCVQELNQLRKDAHSDKAYGAAVAAVMGKAKILNPHCRPASQHFSRLLFRQVNAGYWPQAIAGGRPCLASRCVDTGRDRGE